MTLTIKAGDGYRLGDTITGTSDIKDDDVGDHDGLSDGNSVPVSQPPLEKYAALIKTIKNDYILDHDDDTKHRQWKRVLEALGDPQYENFSGNPVIVYWARYNYEVNGWERWKPIADAIKYANEYVPSSATPTEPETPVEQEEQTTDLPVEQPESPLVKYAELIHPIKTQ